MSAPRHASCRYSRASRGVALKGIIKKDGGGGKKRKEAGSEGKRVRAEQREREREKRVSQKKTIGSAL